MILVAVATLVVAVLLWVELRDQVWYATRHRSWSINAAKLTTARWLIFAGVVMSGVYLGLFKYAAKKPYAACLAGLVLYGVDTLLLVFLNPMSVVGKFGLGLILRAFVLAALLSGVRSGIAWKKYSEPSAGQRG